MSVFGSPQSDHPTPPLWNIAVVAAIGLLVGLLALESRWRGLDHISPTSVVTGTFQQARQDLSDGEDQTAAQLFASLAQKGDPNAQYWLGYMTERGLGTKRDLQKAVGLYKRAADKNVVAAELRLGELYLHGDLILPDSGRAKTYLERAAYQGEPRAAMLMGEMYRIGVGTPSDLVKAYAWSEVATIEGSVLAKRERDASLHTLDVENQKAAVVRAKNILADIKREATLKSSVAAQSGASGSVAPKPNTTSPPTS